MRCGLRVVDAMTVRPVVAGPRTSIHGVAALMDLYNVGSVVIRRGEELYGIVTESDIVRRGILEGCDPKTTQAECIMTRDMVTVSPGMDLFDAILLMKDTEVRTLPVVDDGKMVGFVTAKDILKLHPELFENLVESIRLREEERKLMHKQGAVIEDDDI